MSDLERKLQQWRDVCISNREELAKDLRSLRQAEEAEESPKADNLLFAGERLRVEIGEFAGGSEEKVQDIR